MEKFRNQYRIQSARLPNWNYGSNGIYFITICTRNKAHFFGRINENKQQQLNASGQIAEQIWKQIPEQFPFIRLDAFVIMPNHVHGLLIIDRTTFNPLEKISDLNLGGITGQHNPMLHKSISRVIRWYKGRCSFEIRKVNPEFGWQTRFHDHVIRDFGCL